MKLGISGRITRATIGSPLTPLFLLAAILVGLISTITIPREEEPQIKVPMVDIRVAAPGMNAPEAVELVAKPLESIVKSIDGVEHVYTQAEDHGVLVTARFDVGSDPEAAATRIDEKIKANIERIPTGVPMPQITVRGISDVPIVVLTLTPRPGAAGQWDERNLQTLAGKLRSEVAKVDNVGLTFVTGGQRDAIRVVPDPVRLAAARVPLSSVMEALSQSGRSFPAGTVRQGGQALAVTAGLPLSSADEVRRLTVRAATGAPVLLGDVARVEQGPSEDQAHSWRWSRVDGKDAWTMAPAVSIAIAKRAGANAVDVSKAVVARVDALKGSLIPAQVSVDVTRNYGATADDKANELIFHLALATVSIVILIGFAIGWREAGVTAIVIPTTIMLTMFASRIMGFSINRVSLFALIFSIGILVDDAIVMIENIARHWGMPDVGKPDGRSRVDAAVDAVAEVGNPTIIATLTVVSALLPMLFVSGLMGPYMAPIPINASAAMVFSFFVAVIIAPWLMIRFARKTLTHDHTLEDGGKLGAIYAHYARRVIATKGSARRFLTGVGVATLVACSMFYFKAVTVKLLPFDNKSEVQLVVDMPAGTSLETTSRVLEQAAAVTRRVPEVVAMEAYAGTAAPFNFNGLVRHYFLRARPEMGDLMVALQPKDERSRSSHAVAVDLRERLKSVALPAGGVIKVVETPPGPPVMATLLAEIYGPDEATRQKTALAVEQIFKSVPFIVDTDNSFGVPRPTLRLVPDRDRLDHYGLSERQVFDSIGALMGGQTVAYAPRGTDRDPLPIEVGLDQSQRNWNGTLAATPVAMAPGGQLLSLGELVDARQETGGTRLFRRDGRGAAMVMADLAGRYEAPIYGLLAVDQAIDAYDWKAHGLQKPQILMHGQPDDESHASLLWDGEWEITWVTFRDMGGAFMIALVGIYVLVVGQFGSFRLPLVILTPVPLTLIGIVLGHMLFGAPFTATSMIGFIALAGIIVRNSILLVDFIRHTAAPGKPLREVLIEAGRIRVKPIALTAAAAMIGASVILTDPIFQGLAISLLFGLASSTLLTLLVIPAIYVVLRDDGIALSGRES
ncbi:RND transporter, HAE1/HME family, permease protein [Novosphingobium nitrogenifigens DSM 19370]|uniref:RND transporter, HAE1/HME family, permease protein n=1 Tax=Novosphingobium nitrogenifigens DSM 19370 TaxID=983920 RepID=F1Z6H7_9SPHN|nr:efflux RND transporter permease subunit [Novosphingobium nitrogenifigens]EGD59637.1 RND transporter, HAE1/HME family, permease protein [Novosphingobium nitrogenifigens DSM 19370]